jgi:hypothetical protein
VVSGVHRNFLQGVERWILQRCAIALAAFCGGASDMLPREERM